MNAIKTLLLTLVLGASFVNTSEAIRLRSNRVIGAEGQQLVPVAGPAYDAADVDTEEVTVTCPQMAIKAAKGAGAWLIATGYSLLRAGYSYGADLVVAGYAKVRGNK